MAFRLHVSRQPEVSVVAGLVELSRGLPPSMRSKRGPQVYLARDPHGTGHYLLASNGVAIRVQPVSLFWSHQTLIEQHYILGPLDHAARLPAWLQDDGADPLPDLSVHPALLVAIEPEDQADPGNSWRLEFPHQWDDPTASDLAVRLLQHLRQAPPAFRPWFTLMHARALRDFTVSFPEDLEPPIHWIPEPQDDGTWAKYWAFHATTGAPLGVLLGVRSPETLKRFRELHKI